MSQGMCSNILTVRRYASAVYAMALCLSNRLCLSVSQSRSSTKTDKSRIMLTVPHSSLGALIFICQTSLRTVTRGKMQVGQVKIGDFQ